MISDGRSWTGKWEAASESVVPRSTVVCGRAPHPANGLASQAAPARCPACGSLTEDRE